MKIKLSQLKSLIKEEVTRTLNESRYEEPTSAGNEVSDLRIPLDLLHAAQKSNTEENLLAALRKLNSLLQKRGFSKQEKSELDYATEYAADALESFRANQMAKFKLDLMAAEKALKSRIDVLKRSFDYPPVPNR